MHDADIQSIASNMQSMHESTEASERKRTTESEGTEAIESKGTEATESKGMESTESKGMEATKCKGDMRRHTRMFPYTLCQAWQQRKQVQERIDRKAKDTPV